MSCGRQPVGPGPVESRQHTLSRSHSEPIILCQAGGRVVVYFLLSGCTAEVDDGNTEQKALPSAYRASVKRGRAAPPGDRVRMFERFTARARRVIFFARYEASVFGSNTIETHHLLLALFREDRDLMRRCVGSLAEVYSAGFRFGALVGWHVTPRMSMNGELTLDFMDADTDSSFVKPHERYLDFALSPLLHFRSGEIVVGPKLGWFTNNRSDSDDDRVVYLTYGTRLGLGPHSGQGLLLGINAGGFISVGKLAIGLVASGTFRHFITVDCSGYGCGGQFSNATALSLSLASLF